VLADFDPVLPPAYRKADFVMLGNLTPQVQMRVLDQLERRPRSWCHGHHEFLDEHGHVDLLQVLRRMDVLTINDEEARQLSGEHSLVKAAEKIHEMGPRFLIIKKGEHGALLFHGEEVFFAPALPLAIKWSTRLAPATRLPAVSWAGWPKPAISR
jgi:fructose-1-phosphate kinase PfkB-like protein